MDPLWKDPDRGTKFRAQRTAELIAVVWLVLVAALALVASVLSLLPDWFWLDHPVAFSVLMVGVLGAYITWTTGLVDLPSLTKD